MKASPPPPAPSPPRRHESGFGPRSNRAPESQAAVETERFEEEMPTAAGHQGEPSTLNRGPVTVPREMVQATPRVRANVMRVEHFDDETQARPVDDQAIETLRREMQAKADLAVDYESLPSLEVRAPYDTYEKAFSERDPVTQLARESARVRRAPDVRSRNEGSYREPAHLELPYQEPSYREPAYQEPAYQEPAYQEPSYKEPSYQEPSYQEPNDQQDDEFWGRREGRRDGSGARQRPLAPPPPPAPPRPQSRVPSFDDASDSRPWGEAPAPAPLAYAATGFSSMPAPHHGSDYPAYPQPMIPPAPRVPEEMRAPAFVMGVQPIRTATPDAWGTPHAQHAMPGQGYLPSPMQAMHGSLPAGYAGNVAANQVMPGMVAAPRAMNPTPYPQQQQGYYQRPQHPGQRHQTPMPGGMNPSAGLAHPVGAQLTQPPPSAKVGRFAWFVAGAAFGITFAFFATGFFNGSKVATQDFPAAPALTVTAPAAPVAPPVAAPVAPVVITAAQLPNVPPVAAPQSGIISSAPAPVVSTPPKSNSSVSGGTSPFPSRSIRSSRGTARRPAAPAPQGPRALPGSGETDAPAPAAPVAAPSSGGGDLSDLLGAGLKP